MRVFLWENAWAAEGFTLDRRTARTVARRTELGMKRPDGGPGGHDGFDGGRIEAALHAVGAPRREDWAWPTRTFGAPPFVQ
jgi:hypothetical protein